MALYTQIRIFQLEIPADYYITKKNPPFALRTSSATTTTMRTVLTRVVMSTTVIGMSRIPTGRSPALDYADYYAYFVSSGGGVDNYSDADWDSCGNIYTKKIFNFRSPYLSGNAYYVYSDGSVYHWNIGGSYGHF